MYHKPVLLQETIDLLAIKPEGIYVDVTFGGGGHSHAILDKLTTGRLIGFDQDKDALKNTIQDPRFLLINQNFKFLTNFLRFYKAIPVDGILADLGISSHQIDNPSRGFSTRFDADLDLRMDQNAGLSAGQIVNTYNADELKKVFKQYGEFDNAWHIAQRLIAARSSEKITTTAQLKEILKPFAEKGRENKFYARIFQALRIEVNNEIEILKEFLIQTVSVIKPGGRLVVISYHSLEDRLVKNFMKSGNFEAEIEKDFYGNIISPYKAITRKPITPPELELEENPRSRSAKLRAAERTSHE
ncbi:MAG: 16S rRNA (cytosine(1402)-N(4))-methyltransferase RsmH [Omnitrophica WOR_2 bacterium]|jgi:16S rRNA (cytosine1402-N4)-methyltransferase